MSSFFAAEHLAPPPTIARHYEAVAFGTVALLWRRRLLIVSGGVLVLLATWLALTIIPPRYSAEVLFQFDFGRDDAARSAKGSGSLSLDPSSLVESEARIMRSMTTARAVVDRLGLASQEAATVEPSVPHLIMQAVADLLPQGLAKFAFGPFGPRQELSPAARRDMIAARLRDSLSVTNDTKSYLLTIGFRDTEAKRAADIANAFAQEYLTAKMEAAAASMRRAGDWYAAQIRESRANLDRIEARIGAFRQRTGFVEVGVDGGDLSQQRMRDTLVQLSAATAARIAEETRVRRVQDVLSAGNVPSASDLAGAPVIQRLLETEAAARKEVSDLSVIFGERHPSVVKAKAALDEAQGRLRAQVAQAVANIQADVQAARASEAALSERVEAMQQRLIESKAQETQLKALQADAVATRDRIRQLTEGYEQANALGDLKPVIGQIVSKAEAPNIPNSPNVALALGLALLGGLAGGVATTLLLEKRDRGFRTENELQQETRADSFGLVPAVPANPTEGDAVIVGEAIRFVVAATFSSPSPPKVVLITSSVPNEGKTFVALAMARVLSMMGRSVLLIDASPRRLLIGDGRAGPFAVVERLLGQAGAAAENKLERISVVRRTSGLRDGRGVFSSDSFETMLKQARERYDVVLLEVPSVMLLADIVLLRDHADTIIHVVRWHDTLKSAVMSTFQQLSSLGLHVRGVVLNRVDLAKQRSFRRIDRGSFYRDYSSFFRDSA